MPSFSVILIETSMLVPTISPSLTLFKRGICSVTLTLLMEVFVIDLEIETAFVTSTPTGTVVSTSLTNVCCD